VSKVSVVIPSRQEQYLQATISDVFDKARGAVEVVAVIDGGRWPDPPITERENLTIIRRNESRGMRPAINDAVAASTGEFIFKLDAHCMVAPGFDEELKNGCDEKTIVVPRRKRLDPATWSIKDVGKCDVDAEFCSFPDNPADFGGPGLNGRIWTKRILERQHIEFDENFTFQGSGWFARKSYFYDLELMDTDNYGPFWNEAQEICLKAWLSGGRVMTNKKTWYAHWHKGKENGRGYHLSKSWLTQGATFTKKWIHNEAWAKQTKPFHWLIEHFWPVPTWPSDWREQLNYREP
jgi:glycosyltransferase involved in cell wall biosynthesis